MFNIFFDVIVYRLRRAGQASMRMADHCVDVHFASQPRGSWRALDEPSDARRLMIA